MDIIVTGHGNFATGIASTVQLLAGSVARIHYVDFTEEMSDKMLAVAYQKIIQPEKSYVFFCDLIGGTPYKEAAKISVRSPQKVGVVAGCNVASLLEIGLSLSDCPEDMTAFTDNFVKTSLKGTQVFQLKSVQQETSVDGI